MQGQFYYHIIAGKTSDGLKILCPFLMFTRSFLTTEYSFLLKVPTTYRAGYQYKKKHKILNLNLTVLLIFFVAPQGFGPEAITRGARLYTYMDKEYLFKKCL